MSSGAGPDLYQRGAAPGSRQAREVMQEFMTATTDSDEFARLAGGYRRELLAYCYRMLGSVEEAEEQVQETLLRAWRGYAGFQGRASLRTWLYRIATNSCLRA